MFQNLKEISIPNNFGEIYFHIMKIQIKMPNYPKIIFDNFIPIISWIMEYDRVGTLD